MQSIPVDEQTESCCRKTRERDGEQRALRMAAQVLLGLLKGWLCWFFFLIWCHAFHPWRANCQTKGVHQKKARKAIRGTGSGTLSSKIKR